MLRTTCRSESCNYQTKHPCCYAKMNAESRLTEAYSRVIVTCCDVVEGALDRLKQVQALGLLIEHGVDPNLGCR